MQACNSAARLLLGALVQRATVMPFSLFSREGYVLSRLFFQDCSEVTSPVSVQCMARERIA